MTTTPERTPGRSRLGGILLPVTACVCALLASAAAGLSGVIYGWSWFLPVLITLQVTGTALVVPRFFTRSAWVPYAVGAVALGLILNALFLSDRAFLGILPSPAAWGGFWNLMAEAQNTVQHEFVPVNPGPGITYLVSGCLGLLALITDWIVVRARHPLAAAGPVFAVLLVPALLNYTSVGAWPFAATAFFFTILLAVSRRALRAAQEAESPAEKSRGAAQNSASRGLGRATVLGSAAVALALLVPALVPGFTEGLFPQGSRLGSLGKSNGLNPVLSLSSNLRQQGTGTVMSYVTDASSPPYLRLTTIDSFSGDRWEPEKYHGGYLGSVRQFDDGKMRQTPEKATEPLFYSTVISTHDFSSPYLPMVTNPAVVEGAKGDWGYDADNLTVRSRSGDSTSANEVYTVRSFNQDWSAEELRRPATVPLQVMEKFRELPANVPRIIGETALQVTRTADTPFDKAMALQRYLRGPGFSYSVTAPADHGYDGTGMEVLAKFLDAKSGYCIHYATAMAVMARAIGIPSRVAVGFAPGRATGVTQAGEQGGPARTEYAVAAQDAHAWPEIYLEGPGWIPFEPTPSRGIVPGYAVDPSATNVPDFDPEGLRPRATSTATSTPQPSASATTTPVPQAAPRAATPPWWESLDWGHLVWAAAAVVVLGIASVLPQVLRGRQRRRRLSPAQSGIGVRIGAMEELLATAEDHGVPARDAETPRAFAARLEDGLPEPGRVAVRDLVRDYESARYGDRDDGAEADSTAQEARERVAAVERSLGDREGRLARWRARWVPPSLWRSGQRRPGQRRPGRRR
ncbi:DUF3488 and transglutaminase-like domain-containing protein [Arthrobacter sp.]|uniref:transglutaminase TgpA family protein n=1 Tax=Arthrobacter sp. TaxID=1667 RepID=UPI0025864072|nr:DUF3488 and transglutaminase-like domain-containing protein [Arthrobacter sp.]